MATTVFDLVRRGDLEGLKTWTGDVNVPDAAHWIPLEYAIFHNHLHCVKYLVKERGAIVNNYDENGQGPIHMATRCGRFNCLQYLVENGANVNATSKNGCTPFSFAIVHGFLDFAKYLYSNGADPCIEIRNVRWNANIDINLDCLSFAAKVCKTHKERRSILAMMSTKTHRRFGQQSTLKVLPGDIIRRLHTYFV
jgi:hypothetical protein